MLSAPVVNKSLELKTAIDSYFKARPVNVNRVRVQADDANDSDFWKED